MREIWPPETWADWAMWCAARAAEFHRPAPGEPIAPLDAIPQGRRRSYLRRFYGGTNRKLRAAADHFLREAQWPPLATREESALAARLRYGGFLCWMLAHVPSKKLQPPVLPRPTTDDPGTVLRWLLFQAWPEVLDHYAAAADSHPRSRA